MEDLGKESQVVLKLVISFTDVACLLNSRTDTPSLCRRVPLLYPGQFLPFPRAPVPVFAGASSVSTLVFMCPYALPPKQPQVARWPRWPVQKTRCGTRAFHELFFKKSSLPSPKASSDFEI